jgi:hypothetical protein
VGGDVMGPGAGGGEGAGCPLLCGWSGEMVLWSSWEVPFVVTQNQVRHRATKLPCKSANPAKIANI